jgi:hypothetical protein
MVNEGTKIEETKYFGVKKFTPKTYSKLYWQACIIRKGELMRAQFEYTDEGARQAALCIDKFLIRKGYEPINILKRKK